MAVTRKDLKKATTAAKKGADTAAKKHKAAKGKITPLKVSAKKAAIKADAHMKGANSGFNKRLKQKTGLSK